MVGLLTCMQGNDLTTNFLETIRVVVNMGGVYEILAHEPELPNEDVEESRL